MTNSIDRGLEILEKNLDAMVEYPHHQDVLRDGTLLVSNRLHILLDDAGYRGYELKTIRAITEAIMEGDFKAAKGGVRSLIISRK